MTSKRIVFFPPLYYNSSYSIAQNGHETTLSAAGVQGQRGRKEKSSGLLREGDGADRAGLGGLGSGGHCPGGDLTGLGHGEGALHPEHLGAERGALGAADAQGGINECFHKNCLLLVKRPPRNGPGRTGKSSMGGGRAKYPYAFAAVYGTINREFREDRT